MGGKMRNLTILALATVASASAFAQNLYSNQSGNVNVAALNAVTTTRSGVAAGAGTRWSEVQANGAGVQLGSNTNAGSTVTGAFRLADDFTVTGAGWNVTGFRTYAYQTGTLTSPFSGGTMNVWNGTPGVGSIVGTATYGGASSTIVWDASGASGIVNRIFCTNSPAPGTAPGTTRRVHEITWNMSQTLVAGTYWIDWGVVATNLGTAFGPTTTHQDSRGPAGANALQLNGTWVPIFDAGNPATEPDVFQDLPFIVRGTAVPEPATMVALGLGAVAFIRRRRK